ncbi:hypothetical protein BaRGS_00031550, partial [Batillaria attramentaria]
MADPVATNTRHTTLVCRPSGYQHAMVDPVATKIPRTTLVCRPSGYHHAMVDPVATNIQRLFEDQTKWLPTYNTCVLTKWLPSRSGRRCDYQHTTLLSLSGQQK